MPEQSTKVSGATPLVTSLGECMIEIVPLGGDQARLHHAGDAYNFAFYLSALSKFCNCKVAFATVVGKDIESQELVKAWGGAGVGTSYILEHPSRTVGLYIARNNPDGSKAYTFHRSQSAAREMFQLPESDLLFGRILEDSKVLYTSAITGAIVGDQKGDRQKLIELFRDARKRGITTVFDSNFRRALWNESTRDAGTFIDALLPEIDIALPTDEDLKAIYGFDTPRQMIEHLKAMGAGAIILKQGASGCTVHADGVTQAVETVAKQEKIDTTAAGDSFNAGALAGVLQGLPLVEAARHANRVASFVLDFPGALIPRPEIPNLQSAWVG